jgi:hypothetical protein
VSVNEETDKGLNQAYSPPREEGRLRQKEKVSVPNRRRRGGRSQETFRCD